MQNTKQDKVLDILQKKKAEPFCIIKKNVFILLEKIKCYLLFHTKAVKSMFHVLE